MSGRSQIIIIAWGLVFMYIYGFTALLLLHMVPPPPPTWPAEQVVAFYIEHSFDIRLGAMIMSWVAAFGLPIAVICAIQIRRVEKGLPVWGWLAMAGGITMTMFLIFPPIMWGAAAFTAEHSPEATSLLHNLSILTWITTDQYFIFYMVAMGVVSLKISDPYHGFPRWLGYFTLWAALAFEVGAIAFMAKQGPFAWNGAFVFWMPFVVYGTWMTTISITMIVQIRKQMAAGVVDGVWAETRAG